MPATTLAETAALLADRTRAAFCLALLDGRAWTVTELARSAGVAVPTASEHLSRLIAGGLLAEERQIRPCLDWTERRTHLGGVVGAEICRTALERGWVERFGSGGALKVTDAGRQAFRTLFGVETAAADEPDGARR